MSSLPPRRGAYGFDAPYAPLLMALGGACLLALSVGRLSSGERWSREAKNRTTRTTVAASRTGTGNIHRLTAALAVNLKEFGLLPGHSRH